MKEKTSCNSDVKSKLKHVDHRNKLPKLSHKPIPPSTPTRTRHTTYLSTPKRSSSPAHDIEEESPDKEGSEEEFNITAIGPTPQLKGKILGLFDVPQSSSVNRTPTKNIKQVPDSPVSLHTTDVSTTHSNRNNIFTTPSKKPQIITLKPPSNSKLSFKTPTKSKSPFKQFQTPTYLRYGAPIAPPTFNDILSSPSMSPSPSKFRVKKGLSQIIKELKEQEDEEFNEDLEVLRAIEEDQVLEQELNQDLDDDEDPENKGNESDHNKQGDKKPVWKSKRTQKRTTKHHIFKAIINSKNDDKISKNFNVHEKINKMVNEEKEIITNSTIENIKRAPKEEDQEDYSSEDSDKENVDSPTKKRKVTRKYNTVSNNFRRYKLKNGKKPGRFGGRFGRRS